MSQAKPQIYRARRRRRIRARVKGTAERPRASVFRSLRNMNVQLIDDTTGRTLLAVYGKAKPKQTKQQQAAAVGKEAAAKALAAGIKKIVFDRGGYAYHGRVEAVASAMRQGGLGF